MIADLHPLFLHSTSDMFRPCVTWTKHILALTSYLLELKGFCINGTITWVRACKQYQCRQNWYRTKLCLKNTVHMDVMLQSGRNLLTCQRNTLPPSSRLMTVFFIVTTIRTSTPKKLHMPESYYQTEFNWSYKHFQKWNMQAVDKKIKIATLRCCSTATKYWPQIRLSEVSIHTYIHNASHLNCCKSILSM